MRNRGSTSRGLAVPATFRLQGFVTLLAVYSPRVRAGFLSHRQRSWDSPFGAWRLERYPRVTAQKHPPTVAPTGNPSAEAEGRSRGPRFPGFNPSERSERPGMGLARRPPVAPLGLALLGFARESLDRDFARSPLTRLAADTGTVPTACITESRSALAGLSSGPWTQASKDEQSDPSRVSAPVQPQDIRTGPGSGYVFTGRHVGHYYPPPTSFESDARPYRSCWDCLRC